MRYMIQLPQPIEAEILSWKLLKQVKNDLWNYLERPISLNSLRKISDDLPLVYLYEFIVTISDAEGYYKYYYKFLFWLILDPIANHLIACDCDYHESDQFGESDDSDDTEVDCFD